MILLLIPGRQTARITAVIRFHYTIHKRKRSNSRDRRPVKTAVGDGIDHLLRQ